MRTHLSKLCGKDQRDIARHFGRTPFLFKPFKSLSFPLCFFFTPPLLPFLSCFLNPLTPSINDSSRSVMTAKAWPQSEILVNLAGPVNIYATSPSLYS
ncbi:hypothetical protein BT96DRAFT_488139 [Gymnopus androsaceus JB14]|uniref:Uncharacterized protein n=1 Tax=Gymnopus androsaceus JB14 TaxID=1447944 RepID=A0A6A4GNP8_9AGAR|nr:hypothetical protein BT96DRAFT_488139 [Gymnopus androsaceus JB14]